VESPIEDQNGVYLGQD